ncbi:hypothetical protein DM01DRAFT_1385009 [Hesseltinella vesiculosa]|uniref:Uncharacterized protein n=1 Tax=Hesseltinella vesiculosa TaxID=101127 RepID=A0A1X2GBA5_9FUNG|nr:hypothetical protein DM01DRAFT_1385009 [Hesseltinella vesiculosa]
MHPRHGDQYQTSQDLTALQKELDLLREKRQARRRSQITEPSSSNIIPTSSLSHHYQPSVTLNITTPQPCTSKSTAPPTSSHVPDLHKIRNGLKKASPQTPAKKTPPAQPASRLATPPSSPQLDAFGPSTLTFARPPVAKILPPPSPPKEDHQLNLQIQRLSELKLSKKAYRSGKGRVTNEITVAEDPTTRLLATAFKNLNQNSVPRKPKTKASTSPLIAFRLPSDTSKPASIRKSNTKEPVIKQPLPKPVALKKKTLSLKKKVKHPSSLSKLKTGKVSTAIQALELSSPVTPTTNKSSPLLRQKSGRPTPGRLATYQLPTSPVKETQPVIVTPPNRRHASPARHKPKTASSSLKKSSQPSSGWQLVSPKIIHHPPRPDPSGSPVSKRMYVPQLVPALDDHSHQFHGSFSPASPSSSSSTRHSALQVSPPLPPHQPPAVPRQQEQPSSSPPTPPPSSQSRQQPTARPFTYDQRKKHQRDSQTKPYFDYRYDHHHPPVIQKLSTPPPAQPVHMANPDPQSFWHSFSSEMVEKYQPSMKFVPPTQPTSTPTCLSMQDKPVPPQPLGHPTKDRPRKPVSSMKRKPVRPSSLKRPAASAQVPWRRRVPPAPPNHSY